MTCTPDILIFTKTNCKVFRAQGRAFAWSPDDLAESPLRRNLAAMPPENQKQTKQRQYGHYHKGHA